LNGQPYKVGESGRVLDSNSALPKYYQLKEYIKDVIRRGGIAPGARLPSENSLVQQFGVSRHTIRQAMGGLEKEGLVYREQGRGTFCAYPNKTRIGKIAVLATYISDYIFPGIIRGVDEVISAAGYGLILANTNNDKAKEAECLDSIIKDEVVGLVVEPTKSAKGNVNFAYYRELEIRNIPYVMVNAVYPDLDPAYVVMDDEQGGYVATSYLLQLGHRRIAGIFKADDLQGVSRQAGFVRALAEFGIAPEADLVSNYETEELYVYPYQFARRILQRPERPSAIVCYNDQIALQVLDAVRDEGLRVPDDVSLIGYDDSTLAVASEVKLTTIRHPNAEMGRQAARLLLDMLTDRSRKPHFVYRPELVLRSSCRLVG